MEAQQIVPHVALRRFKKIETVEKKDKVRSDIENHVKDFLSRGGEIKSMDIVEAPKNVKTIRQKMRDTTSSLQKYIDGIPSINIKYCLNSMKYSVFIDGEFTGESHDSLHKANQKAKKLHEEKLENESQNS